MLKIQADPIIISLVKGSKDQPKGSNRTCIWTKGPYSHGMATRIQNK